MSASAESLADEYVLAKRLTASHNETNNNNYENNSVVINNSNHEQSVRFKEEPIPRLDLLSPLTTTTITKTTPKPSEKLQDQQNHQDQTTNNQNQQADATMNENKLDAKTHLSNQNTSQQQEMQMSQPTQVLATRFKQQQPPSKKTAPAATRSQNHGKMRPKSTSMTNLLIPANHQPAARSQNTGSRQSAASPARMQRPVSRSALDNIHRGMNAKYAGVQSKVLLQNIRPQGAGVAASNQSSRSHSTLGRLTPTQPGGRGLAQSSSPNNTTTASQERAQLAQRAKNLQELVDQLEGERENLRLEVEREKRDKMDQVNQLKQELQEKLAESERQSDEQHQKLMEAYEMADQNRRAADTVLSESRQRDEETRKRIEELESQLSELKEFVSMKEEMTGKLCELREQLREERERYEEQLKSLHHVFDNEKISSKMIEPVASPIENDKHPVKAGYFSRLDRNGHFDSFESIGKLSSSNGVPPGAGSPITSNSNNQLNNKIHLRAQQASPGSGCVKCQAGASKLHKSQKIAAPYDELYGSRLSTRMQVGAKSAWRSTKRLASSMVSRSGVSFSGCRHKSSSASMRGFKRRASKRGASRTKAKTTIPLEMAPNNSIPAPPTSQPHAGVTSVLKLETQTPGLWGHGRVFEPECQFGHTSVIMVEAPDRLTQLHQQQHQQVVASSSSGNSSPDNDEPNHNSHSHIRKSQSTTTNNTNSNNNFTSIHKDQNNKLTIVTKFATSESIQAAATTNTPRSSSSTCSLGDSILAAGHSSSPSSGPASGGERSRCGSSSSGRGTSEDGNNSGSERQFKCQSSEPNSPQEITSCEMQDSLAIDGPVQSEVMEAEQDKRGHKKRASSIFKGGLLPAANQLKSQLKFLFTPNNNNNLRLAAHGKPSITTSQARAGADNQPAAPNPISHDNNDDNESNDHAKPTTVVVVQQQQDPLENEEANQEHGQRRPDTATDKQRVEINNQIAGQPATQQLMVSQVAVG